MVRSIRLALFVALVTLQPALAGGVDSLELGMAAEQAGDRNKAIEGYTAAIDSNDLTTIQRATAYYRRGSVWGYLGEHLRGIQDFTKAIELNPRHGSAFSLRGYLRGVIGQFDLAEKDQLAALELAPEQNPGAYRAWVLQHYADLWRRQGQFNKALEYCDRAFKETDYRTTHFRRAWIYLDMGRKAEAKKEFELFQKGQGGGTFWADERAAVERLKAL